MSQTQRRDQVQNGGSCQAEVQSCSYLEIFVFATSTELVDEAVFSVVVGCSIAEVEAVKANTGCLGEVEVGEVLLAGADHQAGPASQEWRQVDGGGEDHGQVSDEERGEGGR